MYTLEVGQEIVVDGKRALVLSVDHEKNTAIILADGEFRRIALIPRDRLPWYKRILLEK